MLTWIKPSLRGLRPMLVGGMLVLDGAVISLLLYLVAIKYTGNFNDYYKVLATLIFILSLGTFYFTGRYKPWRGQNNYTILRKIITGWLTLTCIVMLLLFVFKAVEKYSRIVLLVWFFSTPAVLFMLHLTIAAILRHLRERGINRKTAVIVGAGDLGLSLMKYIERIEWLGLSIVGFFDDYKQDAELKAIGSDIRIIGKVRDLAGFLQKCKIDYVYITLPMRAENKIFEILNSCRTLGARIYLVPNLNSFRFFNGRLKNLGEIMLLDFNPDFALKRLFDICFALSAIIFTLPITLMIALAIKLFDGGPIFFKHLRVTVSGRDFYCLKFRTMHVDAVERLKKILEQDPSAREEWNKTFKVKNDPRVTYIGKFLRKTSLDELPQFVNVLKGEMSVVGARPIVKRELCEYYKEKGGIYCSVKPGITGMWQVGKRSDIEDYQERVRLDTWYALNCNFWLDLKIVFLTVICMFRGNGAY